MSFPRPKVSAPMSFVIVLLLTLLPALVFPFLMVKYMDPNMQHDNFVLLVLFPVYTVFMVYLAYISYAERKWISWILVGLVWLSFLAELVLLHT